MKYITQCGVCNWPIRYKQEVSVVGFPEMYDPILKKKNISGKMLRSRIKKGAQLLEKDNIQVYEIRIPDYFLDAFLLEFKKELDLVLDDRNGKYLKSKGYIGDLWSAVVRVDNTLIAPEVLFLSHKEAKTE